MARIKLSVPDTFIFSVDIPVRSTDINRGGHVGWNSMFGILDDARARFWKHIDFAETDNPGFSNIMADAAINYKRQTFFGQTLRVEIAAQDLTEKSFDLVYRITDVETGAEVARAKTGMAFFNYEKQKIISIPEHLRTKLLGE